MAQDNVSLSVSRRIARQSLADGSQLLECPIMRMTLPELAHLEILPAALNLASMAMDILPEARCRNARFTRNHMLLSDWHSAGAWDRANQPAFYLGSGVSGWASQTFTLPSPLADATRVHCAVREGAGFICCGPLLGAAMFFEGPRPLHRLRMSR